MTRLRVESGRTNERWRKAKHGGKSVAERASWWSRGAGKCARRTGRTPDDAAGTWDAADPHTHADFQLHARQLVHLRQRWRRRLQSFADVSRIVTSDVVSLWTSVGSSRAGRLCRVDRVKSGAATLRLTRSPQPAIVSRLENSSCALQLGLARPMRSSKRPLPRRSGTRWVCWQFERHSSGSAPSARCSHATTAFQISA